MITCSKKYTDLPFAHRQHNHKGHCAFIHGHNWSFEFTFGAKRLDENNFVIDFGKLKWLKDWLNQMFDHTLLLNQDDPMLEYFKKYLLNYADIRVVPSASSEGLAAFVFAEVGQLLLARTDERVFLVSLKVYEDEKNAAEISLLSTLPCNHG